MKVLTVGRSSQNDVVLSDSRVSRVHCQFVQYDNGLFGIIDTGSTNGTFVNGRRIMGECPLQRGDHVRIGDTVFQWEQYFVSQASEDDYPSRKSIAVLFVIFGGLLILAMILWFILVSSPTSRVVRNMTENSAENTVLSGTHDNTKSVAPTLF